MPWRTVLGNIELQLELRGERPENYREQIDSLLNSVSLKGMEQRMPHELSGGMQQRAALCQALIHQPQTLLLDEPLGKLDAMTRENIRGDLQKLWLDKKPTVVMVTHSIEEAVQMSTRVYLISPRPGKIDKVVDIEMDYPRNLAVKQDPRFIQYIGDIHSSLSRLWGPMSGKALKRLVRWVSESWMMFAFFAASSCSGNGRLIGLRFHNTSSISPQKSLRTLLPTSPV